MKKLTINIEELPRELQANKSVCDVVKDYLELDERVDFVLIQESKNVELKFTLQDFKDGNDNMTRMQFIADVQELVVQNCVVNTGREIAYQDKDGNSKSRIEKLPKYTHVVMKI